MGPLQNSGLQNLGLLIRTIKHRDMTEKEKEKIAMAGILQDVDFAVEGLKADALSIADTFGKVIGAEFCYWFGAIDYCSAAFNNEKIFDMVEMLVVLTKLGYWVESYGSLLAVRCAINDWWDYMTETGEPERMVPLLYWLTNHQPKGGKR